MIGTIACNVKDGAVGNEELVTEPCMGSGKRGSRAETTREHESSHARGQNRVQKHVKRENAQKLQDGRVSTLSVVHILKEGYIFIAPTVTPVYLRLLSHNITSVPVTLDLQG